jgi:hypothetical protein
MKKTLLFIFLITIGLYSHAQSSKAISDNPKKYNEFARFFACMDQEEGSSIKHLDTNKVWIKHHQTFTRFWDSANTVRILPMTEFAQSELKIVGDSVTKLFYPFSGPDFLHANIFFPKAHTIVMLGLEKVGKLPQVQDLTEKKMDVFLKAVRQSLDSIFIWGYFMTNDMNKDFARSLELNGVTPVLMLMMAKTGFEVENVKKVTINAQGKLIDCTKGAKDNDSPWDAYVSGVEVSYRKGNEPIVRKLYYFSHDASDKSMQNTPGFIKFLASQHFDATYLKAASYLANTFHAIRKEAMKVNYVLQDDSGILHSYFDEKNWDGQFWGEYKRPIAAFKWAKQPKLREIYVKGDNVRPLPFDIGYGSRIGAGNMMLFTRKTAELPSGK